MFFSGNDLVINIPGNRENISVNILGAINRKLDQENNHYSGCKYGQNQLKQRIFIIISPEMNFPKMSKTEET